MTGDTPFITFAGGGFGTVQIERAVGDDPAPQPVSSRRYLRDHLPAMYSDDDFAMRLVAAFEAVLDPLVATLDNLADHFDPAHAPRDALELAFPGVAFRVEDAGAVRWSLDPDEQRPAALSSFVVYCDTPLSQDRLAAVARLIDQAKPAHVAHRLRVRASTADEGGEA